MDHTDSSSTMPVLIHQLNLGYSSIFTPANPSTLLIYQIYQFICIPLCVLQYFFSLQYLCQFHGNNCSNTTSSFHVFSHHVTSNAPLE